MNMLRGLGFIVFAILAASCHPEEKSAADADVREFLTRYFATWSAQDMDGYGACFHEQARVSFVHQGVPQTQGLTDFIHGQKLGHATSPVQMTEAPKIGRAHV